MLVCVSNLSLLGLQPNFLILKEYKIRKEAKKMAYQITLLSLYATVAPENRNSGARSDLSVCLYVYPIVARQLHGKQVSAATNSQETIKELLDASFSVRFVSYQRKVN
jgi:hypothetical protein